MLLCKSDGSVHQFNCHYLRRMTLVTPKTKGTKEQKLQWTTATNTAMNDLGNPEMTEQVETPKDESNTPPSEDGLDVNSTFSSIGSGTGTEGNIGPDELEGAVTELKHYIKELQGQQDDVLQDLTDNMTAVVSVPSATAKKNKRPDVWSLPSLSQKMRKIEESVTKLTGIKFCTKSEVDKALKEAAKIGVPNTGKNTTPAKCNSDLSFKQVNDALVTMQYNLKQDVAALVVKDVSEQVAKLKSDILAELKEALETSTHELATQITTKMTSMLPAIINSLPSPPAPVYPQPPPHYQTMPAFAPHFPMYAPNPGNPSHGGGHTAAVPNQLTAALLQALQNSSPM